MYGAVPPVAVKLTAPVELPKHNTFVCDVIDADKAAAGSVIVTEAVVVHKLASVTVTE